MVRIPRHRHAEHLGLLGDGELQPPPQCTHRVEDLREPEPHDPPELQLPVERPAEHNDRLAAGRERLQLHEHLIRRFVRRLQRPPLRRVPRQAGQNRPHDHRGRLGPLPRPHGHLAHGIEYGPPVARAPRVRTRRQRRRPRRLPPDALPLQRHPVAQLHAQGQHHLHRTGEQIRPGQRAVPRLLRVSGTRQALLHHRR